jgi:hypothetical protein
MIYEPDALWNLVEACWSPDPAHRPTANQVVETIQSWPDQRIDPRPAQQWDDDSALSMALFEEIAMALSQNDLPALADSNPARWQIISTEQASYTIRNLKEFSPSDAIECSNLVHGMGVYQVIVCLLLSFITPNINIHLMPSAASVSVYLCTRKASHGG